MNIRMVYNGRSRDSLLMPMGPSRPMGLVLQFRIRLVRCEPTTQFNVLGTRCTGNGILHDEFGNFNLLPWTDAQWNAFRDNFVGMIVRYWDGAFELVPDRPWYPAPGTANPLQAASVTCNLSIALEEQAARAHHTYYIIRPQGGDFRSFADPVTRQGMFTHRDLSTTAATRRTRVGTARHSVDFLQTTVLHEFGHSLGLDHVRGRGNNDANYGVTLDQRHNIMGMGGRLTERGGRPWIYQLTRRHLIRSHSRDDQALRFTARLTRPQLITYWDNDWVAPTPAAH